MVTVVMSQAMAFFALVGEGEGADITTFCTLRFGPNQMIDIPKRARKRENPNKGMQLLVLCFNFKDLMTADSTTAASTFSASQFTPDTVNAKKLLHDGLRKSEKLIHRKQEFKTSLQIPVTQRPFVAFIHKYCLLQTTAKGGKGSKGRTHFPAG